MKIHKSIKTERALQKDVYNRFRTEVALLTKEGDIVATNGRIAAVVPGVAEASDDDRFISADVIKATRASGGAANLEGLTAEIIGGVTMPLEGSTAGEYPNWRNVIPAEDESLRRICIDASLLLRLAEALGAGAEARGGRAVVLQLAKDHRHPIRVTVTSGAAVPSAYGVIMPLSTEA